MAKKLKQLTIKDNFMFGVVMADPENCRQLLEISLGLSIERVVVDTEKSIAYHPEYRSVRLDVYAKDEKNTHYNVEMQVIQRPHLEKRARYYHSQMDMKMLMSGLEYEKLPNAFVIFICDFDPFGHKKYRYTCSNYCRETEGAIEDGSVTVFLSTYGENEHEVSESLVKFLQFVKADLKESERNFEDKFVKRLQNTISQIKINREMEERFMLMEELLKDERVSGEREGKAQFVLELLACLGQVPDELAVRIKNERNLELLSRYHILAARANSIEDFMKTIQ